MKLSSVLVALSFLPAVTAGGHTVMNMTMSDVVETKEQEVLEEVTTEVLAEVEAVSTSSTVSNEVVYDITKEVVSSYGITDDSAKAILGHITDAVAELETINMGGEGAVSDILTEIMHTAYGTDAPTPGPTEKVEEPTMISAIKNTVVGATETVEETVSSIISSVFNPAPTAAP